MRKFNGLRPQDIVVLLKIVANWPQQHWQGKELAQTLELSTSEISDSLARCRFSRLLASEPQQLRVQAQALRELLVFGVPYVFAIHPGPQARGVVTGASAAPLHEVFGAEPAYVWPSAAGEVWGVAVDPLYAGVPAAARRDPRLHELLALVDALRLGRPRERQAAGKLLDKYLHPTTFHHAGPLS